MDADLEAHLYNQRFQSYFQIVISEKTKQNTYFSLYSQEI